MSNNNLPPGLLLPSIKGMYGTSPRDDAYLTTIHNNSKLASLSGIGGGVKKIRKYSGGFVNPQLPTIYNEIGASGKNVNDIHNKLSTISTQNFSNAMYDSKIGQIAGNHKKYKRNKTKSKSRRYKSKTRRYKSKSRRYKKK